MSSKIIIDTLQRVQNNAIYIDGNWFKISRKTKLPPQPLQALIGTTVRVKITGKWVDEITPVKKSKDIEFLLEELKRMYDNLKLDHEMLQKRLDNIEKNLEELLSLLAKYVFEEERYESKTKE